MLSYLSGVLCFQLAKSKKRHQNQEINFKNVGIFKKHMNMPPNREAYLSNYQSIIYILSVSVKIAYNTRSMPLEKHLS